jgi:GMP synthase-like glutamine amidotransferase
MRIGILQTGQAPDALKPEAGDYPDMFERLLDGHGFTFSRWHVEAMQFPAGVHAADGWLITGSRHGAYEDHPFIPPLEDFIRQAYAAGVPVVGVCFGHQIIAQAMGGRVERHAAGWAVGPTDYDFGGERMTLNAWHRDQVTAVPGGAQVVAGNDFCANAALLYDDRMFSVQAHPEFRPDFVEGLMRTRGPGLVPDPLMAAARARAGETLDAPGMAGRIAAFFKMPRSRAAA